MRKGGFSNWAGNQRCIPESVEAPDSVDALAQIVRRASDHGRRVKAVGAGHSFTSAALTDGILVRLDRLTRIHEIDAESGIAIVDAGITLRQLSLGLDAAGRALPNLGDIDVQTLAGATATATHGTGAELTNISARIVGLEIVTGAGEVLWCDESTNAEVFRCARVGIGVLGIITRLAIRTVPAFTLHAVEGTELVDDVMEEWKSFARSADHVEFFWLPGGHRCYVKRNNVTGANPKPASRISHTVEKILFENVALDVAMRISRRFPRQTPRLRTAIEAAATDTERVDKSFRIFASPRHVRFVEMEYGVPLDDLPEAFARVRAHIDTLSSPPLFPVEVRVSAADDIPLSTASGRDTGWIAIHQYKGMPFGEYFRRVEAIMNDYAGRPHWGKLHYQDATTLRSRYPEWDSFQEVRSSLDPTGTFANDYTDLVLGRID